MDFSIAVAFAYVLILSVLAVYSVHFFYLAIVAWRTRRPVRDWPFPDPLPVVTVQVPIFNERYVVERVIDAVACLDWPHDRLDIQVLDDSTDITREIAAHAVLRWQAAGVNIRHIHRPNRDGFKAGALAVGLRRARGEFIAIFDADFVPGADFLCRTIGAFSDPRIGFVQARWEHLNRNASLLTRLQSLSIDGHFMIEQLVRAGKSYVMNFNGTAGVWRRTAIEDAGGWNVGSLTEDLDLSYRAAMQGWTSVYRPDVAVPSELVPSILAFRRQQTRWAQGSIDCARRLLPVVLRSRLALPAKVEAVMHLTGYAIQTLMLAASLTYPLLVTLHFPLAWQVGLLWFSALTAPMTLAPTFMFVTAQRSLRSRTWWREVPGILLLSVLGAGMALNSTRALLRGLRARPAVFERTPKSGAVAGQSRWHGLSSYWLPGDRLTWLELVLAGLNLYSAVLAVRAGNLGVFLMATLFAAGLSGVALWTLWEAYRLRQRGWPIRHWPPQMDRKPETEAAR